MDLGTLNFLLTDVTRGTKEPTISSSAEEVQTTLTPWQESLLAPNTHSTLLQLQTVLLLSAETQTSHDGFVWTDSSNMAHTAFNYGRDHYDHLVWSPVMQTKEYDQFLSWVQETVFRIHLLESQEILTERQKAYELLHSLVHSHITGCSSSLQMHTVGVFSALLPALSN